MRFGEMGDEVIARITVKRFTECKYWLEPAIELAENSGFGKFDSP
jgi:hypothetical protein